MPKSLAKPKNNNEYKKDLKRSQKLNKPLISRIERYFCAQHLTLENHNSSFEAKLDCEHGVDLLILDYQTGLKAISLRVQPWQGYKTFTLRYSRSSGAKTEVQKMLEGLSLATHVIQGYVENGEVIAAAMIETQELIDYLKTTPEKNLTIRTNRFDNNEFLVITWDELEKDGCEIVYL